MRKISISLFIILLVCLAAQAHATFTFTSSGSGNVTLTVPADSTGRTAELYSTTGSLAYSATCGATSCDMGTVSTATYYWRITDTDGSTFLDNSGWVTVSSGDTWVWTNASLAKDESFGFIVGGDANSNGDCTDDTPAGCYPIFQRGGSNWLYPGNAKGVDLAASGTAYASSYYAGNPPGNAIDGNIANTRWLTTNPTGQWWCVDLGSQKTFNRMEYIQRDLEGFGGADMKIQASNDGCDTNMVDVPGASLYRPQYQMLTPFDFAAQTKRYVRIYFTTVWTRPEAFQIRVFNNNSSNAYADLNDFMWYDKTWSTMRYMDDVNYTSYVTNADGSVTFYRTIPTGAQTLEITATYRQMNATTIRKRMTFLSSFDTWLQFRNALHVFSPSTCVKMDAHTSKACASENHDTADFQSSLISLPHVAGIVADCGCKAGWTIIDAPPTSTYKDNTEVSGMLVKPEWTQAYVQYGKQAEQGRPRLELLANQTYDMNVAIFMNPDPKPLEAQKYAPAALADIYGRTGLPAAAKVPWGTTYQLLRPALITRQDVCYKLAAQHYTGSGTQNGQYPGDAVWAVMGLNEPYATQKTLESWQVATADFNPGGVMTFTNPLNLDPPSFTTSGKSSVWMTMLLGYAVSKGHVTLASSCSEYETCVTYTARDDLYTAINNAINTQGEVITSLCCDSFIYDLWDANNVLDIQAYLQGFYTAAYKSAEGMGSAIDATKYANMKSVYASLYDATDGYIHYSKYGHWKTITDAGASGGTYRLISGDYIAPATARFVVPSGTNQSWSIGYYKDTKMGFMNVYINNVAVTESQIDLYAASPTFTSTAITETVSAGDVITIDVVGSKNVSSLGYKISLDYLTIGGTTYQEDDSNFACGPLGSDCLNGYTRGWKRWIPSLGLYGEFMLRMFFGDSAFADAQLISHIEHMASTNMGNGTFSDYWTERDWTCIPNGYWRSHGCGESQNAGSWFLFDSVALKLFSAKTGNPLIWYKWDEKSNKFTTTGAWSNETDAANYYLRYVWKSSTATDTVVFEGVPYTDAEVYLVTGGGQGTAKIYFDNGGGYDAGTTVDLSAASNPVYTKTGLTYQDGYKIKVEVVSGTVRVDRINARTKADWLLDARLKEEFAIEPSVKEFMISDYYDADYQTVATGQGALYYGWNILFGGSLLYPKTRWPMFDGIYIRRVN